MTARVACCAAWAALAVPAVAWTLEEEPRAAVAVHEERVVVVAERGERAESDAPAAISILEAGRLARLPLHSAAEAVALLPGFHVLFASPFGGAPMETARGFFGGGEAGYVQLRVDGAPLSDLETGGAPWAALAASGTARIEALRGPASPLYGDTALGGVVELRTVAPKAGPAYELGVAAGRFSTLTADARATEHVAGLAATLALDGRRTDGFRAHGAERREGATLRVAPRDAGGRHDWAMSLASGHERREEPGPLPLATLAGDPFASDPLFAADERHEDRRRAALSWQRAAPVAIELLAWGEERRSDAHRTLLLAAGFGDATRRRIDASTLGGSLALRRDGAGGASGWALGLEAARERLAGEHFAPGGSGASAAEVALAAAAGERRRLAGYVTAWWRPAPRLRLAAALRRDETRDRFASDVAGRRADDRGRSAWSPRLGVTLAPRAGGPLVLFASWSEAFKTATLDQLFDPRPFPDGAGGTFTLANPDLRPQRARSLEAGARAERPGARLAARWQLALYRTAVEDEIDFDPLTFRYLNIGSSLHRGVELDGDLWRGTRGRLAAGWEWTETFAREGENAGRQLKNVPRRTARLLAEADLPGGIAAGLAARHLAGRFLDDAHRFPLADATLVDLRLARALGDGDWELRLDLWNLLDERFAWVGLALPDLGGDLVPYAFPGHPRAAMLGLRWRRSLSPGAPGS